MTDGAAVRRVVERLDVGAVYHLAAVKSAEAERRPADAWGSNVDGLRNVLEALRPRRGALFFASSIAAASGGTLYGVTKRTGELLCGHYRAAHGVDARALRLAPLVGVREAPGGGGTADWACEMLCEARGGRAYRCFLAPGTSLPFLHIADAARAVQDFARLDGSRLRRPVGGAVAGFGLTPLGLAREIRRHIPGFHVRYERDPARQAVADSWPRRLGRADAPGGWTFRPRYGLQETVAELLGLGH